MARNDTKKPDAILTADWHLRDDQPVARLDNYWDAQASKMHFIKLLQRQFHCPVIVAGDIFNKPKPGEHLLRWVIENIPDRVVCIPGNHDQINHNMALYDRSGLAVLEAAGKVTVMHSGKEIIGMAGIKGFAYGEVLNPVTAMIVMIHEMTFDANFRGFPGIEGYTPDQLREIFPDAKLILTGHNHMTLFDNASEPLVLNPGPMMRMTADKIGYEPAVWLWFAKDNSVKRVPIPIQSGIEVLTRAHIDEPEERDARMEVFVDRLRNDVEIGMSFKNNLTAYIKKNKIDSPVEKAVWEAVG